MLVKALAAILALLVPVCAGADTTTTLPAASTTTTTLPAPSPCGDPASSGGSITALDALFVLRGAVGLIDCRSCACDVFGNDGVLATDALRVLRKAVGQDLDLFCPPCSLELASASGCVELPAGSTEELSELRVQASLGSAPVAEDCTFELPSFAGSQLAMALTPGGAPMMLGWLDGDASILSARSTAEALLFFALGGFAIAPNLQPQLVALIAEAPERDAVESAIATALAADSSALANGNEAVRAALAAAVDAMADRGVVTSMVGDDDENPRNVLVNPGGPSSGITPQVGGMTFKLQNEFRRPAYAFVDRVSYKPQFGNDVPSPLPITDFAVPPTSGVTNTKEAGLDAALVIFGVQDGKPLAYAPISTEPLVLPLVEGSKSTRYELRVVGPGQSAGALNLLTAAQLAKQQDVTLEFVLKDILLAAVLNVLIPNSSIDELAKIEDFDDLVQDMVELAAEGAPAIAEKAFAGDIKGALGEAWDFVSESDGFRDLILVGVSEAILHSEDFETQQAALNNARTLLKALQAVDAAIQTFDVGAIGAAIGMSNMADTWTLDVIAPVLRINPQSSQIDTLTDQELTVEVLDPDPGAAFTYRWTNTGISGDLIDNQGQPSNDFESSRDTIVYRPRIDAQAGFDKVEAEVFQIDGQERVSIGKAQAFVTVQPPALILRPRKVSLRYDQEQDVTVEFQPAWTGGPILYRWNVTEYFGTATGVFDVDTTQASMSYKAGSGEEGIDLVHVEASTVIDGKRVVVASADGELRVEEQPSIIFGTYVLDVRTYESSGHERVAIRAVVEVPEQEGFPIYRLSGYGGNDPYYWHGRVNISGPPFPYDNEPNRPAGVHWFLLSGGDGPASGTAEGVATMNSRFSSGWIWEIELVR
jgi:hypothetical protein